MTTITLDVPVELAEQLNNLGDRVVDVLAVAVYEAHHAETMNTQDTAWPQCAPLATALAVDDVGQASTFYQQLGFEQVMTLPGSDNRLAFAMVVCGTRALLLGPSDDLHYANAARTALFHKGPRGLGVTLVLDVPDVVSIYEVVKAADVEIILELVEEYYGERVFMFVDPNGYEWKICQKTKTVTPAEVRELVSPSR